jgi:hypothetical protein
MLAIRLNCPHCSKPLKLRQPPLAGRRILCSSCNRSFPVRPEDISTATAATPPAGTPTPPLPSSILTPTAPPAGVTANPAAVLPPAPLLPPKPVGQRAGVSPQRGLLLGVILGGLLLLAGSTALALHFAGTKDDRQTAKAEDEIVQPREPIEPAPVRPAPEEKPAGPKETEPVRPDAPPADDSGRPPAADDAGVPPPPAGPPAPPKEGEPRTEPVALKPAERPWLPRETQEEVNKAIERGVAFLKKNQLATGAWENRHLIAYAALPALTLLECGVPASDPRISKAANLVRGQIKSAPRGSATYELSLALLFLDRLGDPKDQKIIRGIALRLVAGQSADGGWSYQLPVLTPAEENQLEQFLEKTRPADLDRMVQLADGRRLDPIAIVPPEQRPLEGVVQGPGSGSRSGSVVTQPSKPSATIPLPAGKSTERKKPLTEEEARKAATKLPPRLRTIPAVVEATTPAKEPKPTFGSDNSNTQFAALALWTASRYGLPLERSLGALAKRSRRTQADDGSWGYLPIKNHRASPAMTGSGLIGLAVGHGLHTEAKKIKDDQVEKGIRALATHIGKPLGADRKVRVAPGRGVRRGRPGVVARPPVVRARTSINLYFLWTLERVGVIYNLRKMDEKDWYGWGAELLLDAQKPDGFWQEGGYPGAEKMLDTCLALLFLRRANFSTDLTTKLQFVIQAQRPATSSLEGR